MPRAEDCARRIRELFDADLEKPVGVVHPLAVWRPAGGGGDAPPVVLRIGERTPRSDTDRFVLGVVRARADAVLTTGRNLRLEPRLTHALWPRRRGGGWGEALAAWRRERLGRRGRRWSLVLTAGRDLDLGHPLFRGPTRVVILTGEAAARELAPRATEVGAEVAGHPDPGPRAALAWLGERGVADVSVEAGPTTARALYEPPLAVDELVLSTFAGPELDAAVRGRAFLAPRALEALLRPAGPECAVHEPSGPWTFRRWLRHDPP